MSVAALWRYPIKSHGREAVDAVTFVKGQTMPWDRHWAVTHADTKFDESDPQWAKCRNFMIGVTTPGLAGIWAKLDEVTGTVTLRHDALGEHVFRPDDAADLPWFLRWVAPLCPAERRQPVGIVAAPQRGMTDSEFPSVSVMNMASHDAVVGQLGQPLEVERWRGNIWLRGLEAWAEMDWVGQTLRIGTAELQVQEPIERCMATAANPHSGVRDADTLGALRTGWGHQHFGIYATVTKTGKVAIDDKVEVL